jgi:hypothetical protein
VPAFFDYIHPRDRRRPNEKRVCCKRRKKQRQRGAENQREGINRPDGVMIVIVAIHKPWNLMLFLRGCDAVKMRMHRRRMIMAGTWMNVLKGRYKECQ